ncbi:MAG: sulfurtransferase TusA family protein [Candidatus Hermodarchaeota archaeon]
MSIENSTNYVKIAKKKIDIKGYVCPMTFVYTKLALEELSKGDLLEVELNFRPAIKNVPENCKRQGLAELIKIRVIDKKADIYELVLKRI